jgi:predicted dehydrogenase
VSRVHGEIQDANATHGGPSDLTLTLRFVSGAIGGYTASYPALAIPPEPNEMRLYGDRAVMALGNRRVTIYRPDAPAEEHRLAEGDGGYYNEFLNYYDAVVHGEPLVGTIAQSYQNMQIMLKGLESAENGQALALDDTAGGLQARSVPLWRPRGAGGLFDGLPAKIVTETKSE